MLFKPLALFALVSQAIAHEVPTLAEALAATPELSTLGSLVSLNQDLLKTLVEAKNITILAPTNAAFAKLDNATLTAIKADIPWLTHLLQYHVIPAVVPSSAITAKPVFAPTLLTATRNTLVTGGQRVKAELTGGKVVFTTGKLATSTVIKADVAFTGGVIHLIDTPLTIPETAAETAKFAGLTSLVSALETAKLASTVDSLGNVTIFAPTNAAFEAISSVASTLTVAQLSKVLTYHVVVAGEPAYSTSLSNGQKFKTVEGTDVTVDIRGANVTVNGARVVIPDVLVAGGVVHVIDAVLLPKSL